MNFPSDKYELTLAKPQDLQEIKAIFESGQFDGGIAVQFLRDPDPLASFEKEGDKVFLLVLKDKQTERSIGTGACIIRKVYYGGRIIRMGYLSGLKIIPEYQKKIFFIPFIYQQLYELTKDEADIYITTILKDNISAQKLLEKPRKGMPLYEYLGDYRVYFCKAGIKTIQGVMKSKLRQAKEYTARRCTREELWSFYVQQAKETDLSLESMASYDLENAVYYGLFHKGTLVAWGYVLNQQSYKQYVVKSYGGIYKLLNKLPTRLIGYPSFPKVGETANCACAGIWTAGYEETYAHRLWQYMREDAKEFDFLMIGLHESHPLKAYFEKTKHISYDSRCYLVNWEQNHTIYEQLQKQKLSIDVSFL